MSSLSTAQGIIFALRLYTISIYPVIIIGGLLGNFCNIIVFHRFKQFQRNQCAFYLIIESIANFILLLLVLPFRITEFVFAYDPTQLSLISCKLRQALVGIIAILSFASVCYAAIDQYLSTNCRVQLRQFSTLKLSHRLISITILILLVYSIPLLIFFQFQPISGCIISNIGFARFFSFGHFCVFNAILPITISVLFATLAYRNVRRITRRQLPIMRRKLDRQLTALVLTKVAFFVATTLPFVIYRIYAINTSVDRNNLVRIAIEQLILSITTSLYFVNSAGSFYVYLIVSKRFRQQSKHVFIKNIWKKLFSTANTVPRQNQVEPISNNGADLEQDEEH